MNEKPKKTSTGIILDRDLIEYLDELARRSDRSRSWIINSMIREHVRRHISNGQPAQVEQPSFGVITV